MKQRARKRESGLSESRWDEQNFALQRENFQYIPKYVRHEGIGMLHATMLVKDIPKGIVSIEMHRGGQNNRTLWSYLALSRKDRIAETKKIDSCHQRHFQQ